MSTTDYLLNGLLIALVVLQMRGRRLTTRSLLLPIGVVVYAATQYLHGLPTAGNDLVLVGAGVATGLTLGLLCGYFTKVTAATDGTPFAKAGVLAAGLWIIGVGSRLAFELYATHGGGASILHFSVSHDITTLTAWSTALILMAFAEVAGRTGVLAWRARAIRATTAAATPPAPVAPSRRYADSGIVGLGERAF